MDWLHSFPHMQDDALLNMKRSIDDGFRAFTAAYGDPIDAAFQPLQQFLTAAEHFMTRTPWPIIMLLVLAIAWVASRDWKIVAGCFVTLAAIGYLDMWEDTMRTVSMIFVCTLLSILIGLPIGILMAKSNRVRRLVDPVLDVMQTMPSFVYLIPAIMLFGLGKVPAVLATIIYAVPPLIRLTDLGIRQVDGEVVEAATAFGGSPSQILFGVELPLATPTIMAGLNQTIMMALSMVVVASMIGARGLGEQVLNGIQTLDVGKGLEAGLGIVILAIVLDRITQGFGRMSRKERGND